MRRTLVVTSAPIFSRFNRMVPEVALAIAVPGDLRQPLGGDEIGLGGNRSIGQRVAGPAFVRLFLKCLVHLTI
jgi:hypothetical protein